MYKNTTICYRLNMSKTISVCVLSTSTRSGNNKHMVLIRLVHVMGIALCHIRLELAPIDK
jgi:hypothetical protein